MGQLLTRIATGTTAKAIELSKVLGIAPASLRTAELPRNGTARGSSACCSRLQRCERGVLPRLFPRACSRPRVYMYSHRTPRIHGTSTRGRTWYVPIVHFTGTSEELIRSSPRNNSALASIYLPALPSSFTFVQLVLDSCPVPLYSSYSTNNRERMEEMHGGDFRQWKILDCPLRNSSFYIRLQSFSWLKKYSRC